MIHWKITKADEQAMRRRLDVLEAFDWLSLGRVLYEESVGRNTIISKESWLRFLESEGK
jgi:hypothetical protein